MTPARAQTVGEYELLELIDEDIGGGLYRARPAEGDDTVLVKLVAQSVADNPAFGRYFYHRWADRRTMFEHPNVASAQEVGKDGDTYYVVLPDIDGQRLSERMKEGPMDAEEAAEVIRQVAEALRAAHRAEMIHGHLKPSDVFLCRDKMDRPLIKVLFFDLGVAASESMVSVFGELVGAPKYLAPEVCSGSGLTPQSDLFALGVISYELLTGEEPFPSNHVLGYLHANAQGSPQPPHEVEESVPEELSRVICRMLEDDPDTRYQSAQNVIDDLDRCEQSMHTGHIKPPPMGTDSAFARGYELHETEVETGGAGLSAITWAALLLALVSLGVAFFALYGRQAVPGISAPETPQQAGRPRVTGPERVTDEKGKQGESEESGATHQQAKMAYRTASKKQQHSVQTSNYDMAIAVMRKVARDYPDTPYHRRALETIAETYNIWGRQLKKQKQYEAAAEKFQKAMEEAPEDSVWQNAARQEMPSTLAEWASQCTKEGDYKKALSLYKRIENNYPGSAESSLAANKKPAVLYNKAWALWKANGSPSAALSLFQEIVSDYGDTEWADKAEEQIPSAYLARAEKKHEQGSLEQALKDVTKVQEAWPESGIAGDAANLEATLLGKLYKRARSQGNTDRASDYFARLVRNHPKTPWAVRAARRKLGLKPESDRDPYTSATARGKINEAKKHVSNFEFKKAVNKIESVLQYARADSSFAATALQKLPEWEYRWALHTYGSDEEKSAIKKLKDVQKTYGFTNWDEKARTALDRINNAPKGMVYVPEGRFRMGTTRDQIRQLLKPHFDKEMLAGNQFTRLLKINGFDSELPRHVAETHAFYVDKTEVTNKEYKEFIKETGHEAPQHWENGSYPEDRANYPVANVSLADARAYAEWAGKKIPTEVQWEKAARGTDARLYPWGDVFDPSLCRHMKKEDAGAVAVGSSPPGASPYGSLDMIGNVMEWTRSRLQPYEGNELENSQYEEDLRVLKGGAWYRIELAPIPSRAASRYPAEPGGKKLSRGFRCIQPIKQN